MSRQRLIVTSLVAVSVGLGAAAALGESVENLIRRYPYDPACLWGRLANGKGTVVRCLTEKEAAGIAAAPAPAPTTSPSASTDAPATDAATAPATEETTTKGFQVTIGPVTADALRSADLAPDLISPRPEAQVFVAAIAALVAGGGAAD